MFKNITDNDLKDYDKVKFFCPNCKKNTLFTILFTDEGMVGTCCKCNTWEVLKKNENYVPPTKQSPTLTVECPYCHSTDTKKISTMSKAAHTALFGIFSVSRNSKQFHCNDCGADF